jgi:hypothetical protein
VSRSPDEERSRTVLVVVSALAALAFFYSAFVVGQLLLGGLVVLFLFVLSSIYHFFPPFSSVRPRARAHRDRARVACRRGAKRRPSVTAKVPVSP